MNTPSRPQPLLCALLACALFAACDYFGQEPNAPPRAVGTIPDLVLTEATSADVDVAGHFSDPEEESLTFAAAASNTAVAAISISGSVITVRAEAPGATKVVVTAMDPSGQSAQQQFTVTVPQPPVVELGARSTFGPESDGAVLPLSLSTPPGTPIVVTWVIGMDDDETTSDADAGDFVGGLRGSVEIEAGATAAEIEIVFDDDDAVEPPREAFTLALEDPAAGAGYRVGVRRNATGTILEGVCDRTPEVQEALLFQLRTGDCTGATADGLRNVQFITIPQRGFQPPSQRWTPPDPSLLEICDPASPYSPPREGCGEDEQGLAGGSTLTSLKSGDFLGLTGLVGLLIGNTQLETIPADVFQGLDRLSQIWLISNRIRTLPAGLFDGLDALSALNLQRNRLETLPDGLFAGARGLVSLDVSGNMLTSLPAGIETLEDLLLLDAAGNRLTGLGGAPPASLASLDLSDNLFSEVPSAWMVASLVELELRGNRIETVPQGTFRQLGALLQLDLEDNAIQTLAPGAFEGLSALQRLFLSRNRIGEIPAGAFRGLGSLRTLYVGQNEISSVAPGAFTGLTAIADLALDRNRIAGLSPETFAGLATLRRLWLAGNEITALAPETFAGLEALDFLALAVNRLTEVPTVLFEDLAALRRLYLDINKIAELPADLLSPFQALELFHAPQNRIAQLPDGFFVGSGALASVDLRDNPGAPFPLHLTLDRTDGDVLAPGPGTIRATAATGLPFSLTVALTVHGGELSRTSLTIRAGASASENVTVTRTAASAGTQVSAGPLPGQIDRFAGITVSVSDPLVLFGELANLAPSAVVGFPAFRLRAEGDGQTILAGRHFRDADEDELTFSTEVADPTVVEAAVSGEQITVTPLGVGSTAVQVTATDPGGLSATLSFRVLVRGAAPGDFDIQVVLTNENLSDELREIIEDAALWWMTILAGTELEDVPANEFSRIGCGDITVAETVGAIDDLLMVVAVDAIDGVGGALAYARPCAVREESGLPFMGVTRLDADDLASLIENGDREQAEEVVLHEMGHILGIGSLWQDFGLLVDPSLSNPGADTHFPGELAVAAFDAAGGSAYEGGKVPVENMAGAGSGDSHWRQSVMVTELLTPFATPGVTDQLSAITIQSLADMGYTVDVSLADPYTLPGAVQADLADPDRPLIDLRNDVLRGPIVVVDRNGRIVETRGN